MTTSRESAGYGRTGESSLAGRRPARQALLIRFHERLIRMAAVRLDRRLAPRIDPADIVQEVLLEASRDLSDYVRDRPLPFHAWLRQYVGQRISKLHRHHLGVQRRSIRREEAGDWHLPDESAALLAERLIGRESSPSQRILREELRRGSRPRWTSSARGTGRSSSCGTWSSSRPPRRPRSWGSPRRP